MHCILASNACSFTAKAIRFPYVDLLIAEYNPQIQYSYVIQQICGQILLQRIHTLR